VIEKRKEKKESIEERRLHCISLFYYQGLLFFLLASTGCETEMCFISKQEANPLVESSSFASLIEYRSQKKSMKERRLHIFVLPSGFAVFFTCKH
jgi:hypothetical protein